MNIVNVISMGLSGLLYICVGLFGFVCFPETSKHGGNVLVSLPKTPFYTVCAPWLLDLSGWCCCLCQPTTWSYCGSRGSLVVVVLLAFFKVWITFTWFFFIFIFTHVYRLYGPFLFLQFSSTTLLYTSHSVQLLRRLFLPSMSSTGFVTPLRRSLWFLLL